MLHLRIVIPCRKCEKSACATLEKVCRFVRVPIVCFQWFRDEITLHGVTLNLAQSDRVWADGCGGRAVPTVLPVFRQIFHPSHFNNRRGEKKVERLWTFFRREPRVKTLDFAVSFRGAQAPRFHHFNLRAFTTSSPTLSPLQPSRFHHLKPHAFT
jgi:hypothetical protein